MKNQMVLIMTLFVMTFLHGYGDDNDSTAGATKRHYEVNIINLTNNQPFSPVAAVMHEQNYKGMTLGKTVTLGLEHSAESGDNGTFLSDATANVAIADTASGAGVVMPGTQDTLTLTGSAPHLTIVSMLVNTNDAIVALNGVKLENLKKDETMTIFAGVYDTGTEGNSEAASDVPGPAGGGEGFNAARNDRDFIVVHPGVVSIDDGLAASALDQSHRFDNPAAKIVIKRIS